MASLRDELMAQLPKWGADRNGDLNDDTSLIQSGRVDSLGLFELLLWIEAKTGGRLDPTSLDLPREWDTVADIVQYVTRRRQEQRKASQAGDGAQ